MIRVDPSRALMDVKKRVSKKEKEVNKALKVSALQMASHIKESLTSHKSKGRTYIRRSVTHTASAPGYPPNSDIGFLASSVTASRRVRNFTTEVIIGARYAKALEYGVLRRGLKPRPFVKPARQALGSKIAKRIRKAMNAS